MAGTSYRFSKTSKRTLHETEVMFHRFFQRLIIPKMPSLKIYAFARSAFLAAALLKIQVFWHVMPCRLVNIFRRFGQYKCLPLHAQLFLVIFKYNQQEATLHNLFISVKCSTCLRLLIRPSSGVQNCIYSIGYFVKPLLLPAIVVEELEMTVAGSSKGLTKYPMLYIQF